MEELKNHIYDEHNGLHYTLVGDYYIPNLELPEETRHIGSWGRMNKDYLEQLQYIMGHADISVTLNTYTHVKFDDAKDELLRVANA